MDVDLPLDELRDFLPEVEEPDDFTAFWSRHLDEARQQPLEATFVEVDSGLVTIEVLDVSFRGHGGAPIRGWLLMPRDRQGPLPAVVEYIGYGGGRGFPHEWLTWASAGYAHLVMDTRGQGSGWSRSDTPDPGGNGAPSTPGFVTRGVTDPDDYYYLRLFVDAARAVDAAREHPAVDPDRVAVAGISQGGGLALAAAHLADSPCAVMTDVPFLANIQRAVRITDKTPYAELASWCGAHRDDVEVAFRNLRYFDVVNHARHAAAPALFSVALADEVCPPSTVFSAYNVYAGPKDIRVYDFNAHEGGGAHHVREQFAFAAAHLR